MPTMMVRTAPIGRARMRHQRGRTQQRLSDELGGGRVRVCAQPQQQRGAAAAADAADIPME